MCLGQEVALVGVDKETKFKANWETDGRKKRKKRKMESSKESGVCLGDREREQNVLGVGERTVNKGRLKKKKGR